ncbi:uracil-DNA glycosylase [Chthonobacter albigriseus]|uniref:uracil-DNA glycosylase n=1 Tax=Chthonobacter albigriseus TaxID=1683161 RepID=UPI0015EEC1BC|nr:uracil-DNA glycosylase [Chthonobacter albigriseus]
MDPSLPSSFSTAAALEALLDWYAAMGVDAVLDDAPVDRFAESATERDRRKQLQANPAASTGRPVPPSLAFPPGGRDGRAAAAPAPASRGLAESGMTVPGSDAVMAAREAARSAETLEALQAILARFDGCNLKRTAKNMVFGDGNPAARLMFVGEAPGRDEDIEGKPFVGRSGKLLDKMLAALGMTREADAYIANVVFWRPPGNREPSDQEVAICRPFILRQIELVDPDVLVFLGGQPAKALLGGEAARTGIRKLRGRWMEFDTGRRRINALPTFHPAYLLRNPSEKRLAWRDMLAIKAALGGA